MTVAPFIIAVSAGALFDGTDGDKPLTPGLCFDLVKRIYAWSVASDLQVEICVVSRRPPDEGGRLLRAMAEHGLPQVAGCFVGPDGDVLDFVKGCGAALFMSRNMGDVQRAVDMGIPAACMHGVGVLHSDDRLTIAFDGDAVLFDCETERYFQQHGIDEFFRHEAANAAVAMGAGPLMPFLLGLSELAKASAHKLFRLVLVTARSGVACERPMHTLKTLGVELDAVVFCGNIPKIGMLQALSPHVFFDDSDRHLGPASEIMPTGKVPWRTKSSAA